MARAHFVKKAAKDHPEGGIKKGESYYWWAFMVGGRGGPKHYSKTAPRPSQLTQSEFLGAAYDLGERIEDLSKLDDREDLRSAVEELVQEIRDLGEEQQVKFDNMPDSLQQGDTGQLLEGRASACEDWASELEQIDLDEGSIEDVIAKLTACEYQGE